VTENTSAKQQTPAPATPFHDLDAYNAVPRVSGLALSPDGSRLVASVQSLDPEATAWRTALWEVDPTGQAPARRLTRSAKGEAAPVFTINGDLLFTSARPNPDVKEDDEVSSLWRLPAAGGEAEVVVSAPGGIGGVVTAREANVVTVTSQVMPSAENLEQDEEIRKSRKDNKVGAILHTTYPVRYWDHDLGPAETRRFTVKESDGAPAELKQLTGPGFHLQFEDAELTPDGSTLVTSWDVADEKASRRSILVAIDMATGERRTLVDDPTADSVDPAVSPDGTSVAYAIATKTSPTTPPTVRLGLVSLEGEPDPRRLADDWDRWAASQVWLPDGSGLVVTADEDGRCPVFLMIFGATADDEVTVERVTTDAATFSDVVVSPDGATLYALRSSYLAPNEPVRIDLAAFIASGAPGERTPVEATALPGPAPALKLPGRLEEVETQSSDGTRVRGWLALPEDAPDGGKHPLLLWIHGGPLSSWNAWSWRWCPWILVAAGYAVLLPDPALSTGYGQDFIARGWGRWGKEPYTDLMALTDAVEARDDIDETRTAAMGGSFGGYMANWVAGHTDRFKAVVTHASLWALDQFGPTTDDATYWANEMTTEMAEENTPHKHVGQITTPMLVIHGDRDYRVPIGEGLRLWYELNTASGLPIGDDGVSPHQFLYFPDENHWVLTPQHAKIWYEVNLAFLAKHVLGEERELPQILG
jgi:dipeptidyl aminopeptidase/acylaminoacyl peptidase